MAIGILPTKLGVANNADIIVNASSSGFTGQPLVKVRLTAQYNRVPPPGWLEITAAGTVPIGSNPTVGARVLAIGTQLTLPKCEADALLAAGAATAI